MEKSKEISSSRFGAQSPTYRWDCSSRPAFLVQRKRRRKLDLRESLVSSAPLALVKEGLEVGVFGTILATFLSSLWLLG